MLCTACSTDVPEEDLFCENCGQKFPAPEPTGDACSCGAPVAEADEEGFCQQCGRRVRRPDSDHIEEALFAEFAAVSDRGLRHERNEDRFAIVSEGGAFGLVICDGVSATHHPEVASSAVSESVGRSLVEAMRPGLPEDTEALLVEAVARAAAELKEATGAVSQAVGRGGGEAENAPSTTVVSAVVSGSEITVAWVGDSRAYWMEDGGVTLLTRDHSWMNMVLDSGEMTREEAEAAPQAHAITRWIGADAEGAAAAEVVRHRITASGTLLLCTDGLWNYVSEPEALAELLRDKSAAEADALGVARALVAFANEQGGRDNITVGLLRVERSGVELSDGPGDPLSEAPGEAPGEAPVLTGAEEVN